jgi:hypothetical protein
VDSFNTWPPFLREKKLLYPPSRRPGGTQSLSGSFGEEKDPFLPRTEPLFPGNPDLSLVIVHSRSSRLPHSVFKSCHQSRGWRQTDYVVNVVVVSYWLIASCLLECNVLYNHCVPSWQWQWFLRVLSVLFRSLSRLFQLPLLYHKLHNSTVLICVK